MKFKIFLATAGSVLATASALAGSNNVAPVTQTGNLNNALVTQTGSNNAAGNPAYPDWVLNQTGNENDLDILQNGSNNAIGVNSNLGGIGSAYGFLSVPAARWPGSSWTRNNGVDQVGAHNKLAITQTNNYNDIGAIHQKALAGATALTNQLTITQTGIVGYSHQGIGDVYQNNTGGTANVASISQTGGGYLQGNKVYLLTQNGTDNGTSITQNGLLNIVTDWTQTGTSNTMSISQGGGNSNWVGASKQLGTANQATVTQTGTGNELVSLNQDNTGSGSLGNKATLTFGGNYNGVGTLSGDAGSLGLTLATVNQLGDNNLITYSVTGDSNLFAFNQIGDNNKSVGTVTGSNNQAAIKQIGSSNNAPFIQSGSSNNVAISQ